MNTKHRPRADDLSAAVHVCGPTLLRHREGDVEAWKDPGEMILRSRRPPRSSRAVSDSRKSVVDSGRFEEWLDLFTVDCLYWVPTVTADGGSHDSAVYCIR